MITAIRAASETTMNSVGVRGAMILNNNADENKNGNEVGYEYEHSNANENVISRSNSGCCSVTFVTLISLARASTPLRLAEYVTNVPSAASASEAS